MSARNNLKTIRQRSSWNDHSGRASCIVPARLRLVAVRLVDSISAPHCKHRRRLRSLFACRAQFLPLGGNDKGSVSWGISDGSFAGVIRDGSKISFPQCAQLLKFCLRCPLLGAG